MVITNIGQSYLAFPLVRMAQIYKDRGYTVDNIPLALEGGLYIQTANDDKVGNDPNFLNFDVDVPCVVYVAYDRRSNPKPLWLSTFTETSQNLVTSDAVLQLFFQMFGAGMITLGGNGQEQGSMYSVIVTPQGEVVEPIPEPEPEPPVRHDQRWAVEEDIPGRMVITNKITPEHTLRMVADIRRSKT